MGFVVCAYLGEVQVRAADQPHLQRKIPIWKRHRSDDVVACLRSRLSQ
eukprot:CAMPEP_0177613454 /NCGR_PEP_ID=MMETSP0419_2-20121207/21977_1 /TAXON_ID=582737 /ORGANISM="Tetraselmis sp., Strain GSL018" /LENGTH=47 /DNA_ID= /DNA_START= /DNA_END= /DNA_ORIENTATION=